MHLTRVLHLAAAIACSALCAGPTLGQSDVIGPPTKPIDSKFPRIVVEQTEIDLGKIPDDRMAETTLHFRNEGEAALTMRPIRCSCGCTAAKLEKTIYQPGEAGEVAIRFNPRDRRGKQQKTCTLQSNDPQNPSITIKLTCDVMALVWSDPKNLMQVNHPRGLGFSKETIVYSRADEFEIVELQTNNEHIQAEAGKTTTVWIEDEQRHHFQTPIVVTVADDVPIGFINGEVRVIAKAIEAKDQTAEGHAAEEAEALPAADAESEDPHDPDTLRALPKDMRQLEKDEHLIRIPVVIQIVGDINPEPKQLRLPVLEVGAPIEEQFNLVSAGGSKFDIVEARLELPMEGAALEVTHEPLTGDKVGYRFTLVGTAQDKPGMLRGRIIIVTSGDEGQEKVVPFYGSVRPKREEG